MNKLQEKLDFLLEKYSVNVKATLKDEKTVVIDGKEISTLPHRSERRFLELKNIVNNGTLVGISVMRVARIVEKGKCIYDELYREFDLCEYILQRKIKSVMVMENENVLNAIATTQDGVVCTIEISATLKKGELEKDKHEIISQRGIACDVVVDAQLKQDSIYVFGNENQTYTDVDFELYGLSMLNLNEGENKYGGALLYSDLSPKPAFTTLKKLINEEWHTSGMFGTDDNGVSKFKGFKGMYDIEFEYNGKNYKKEIHLDGRDDFETVITID